MTTDRTDGDVAAPGLGRGPRPTGAAASLVSLLVLGSLPLVVGVLAVHASFARRAEASSRPARIAVVKRMPSADFAFASGSRHLRFLSLEEPQAAFADGPCLPDPDPAGGLFGAPRAAFADAVTRGGPSITKRRP